MPKMKPPKSFFFIEETRETFGCACRNVFFYSSFCLVDLLCSLASHKEDPATQDEDMGRIFGNEGRWFPRFSR